MTRDRTWLISPTLIPVSLVANAGFAHLLEHLLTCPVSPFLRKDGPSWYRTSSVL
jgi:hypothetical protein